MAFFEVTREAVGECRLKSPDEAIEELRAFATGDAEMAPGALWEAARLVDHLRTQRDDLQRSNTALVVANRGLKAQIAGRPRVPCMAVGDHGFEPPKYETEGAAGADLRADLSASLVLPFGATLERSDGRPVMLRLHPGARVLVPCGFAFAIPDGYVGIVCGRSSMTKRGILVPQYETGTNGELRPIGVIDPDYTGVVSTYLWNMGGDIVEIEHGQRVSQMLLLVAPQARFEMATSLPATSRGDRGYGSTGAR